MNRCARSSVGGVLLCHVERGEEGKGDKVGVVNRWGNGVGMLPAKGNVKGRRYAGCKRVAASPHGCHNRPV